MNSEHVEVLRHMKETIKAIMPSEIAALDAAIASLSAQQPPAEAQPVAWLVRWQHGRKRLGITIADSVAAENYYHWRNGGENNQPVELLPLYTAPPITPVGVEGVLRDALQGLIDFIEIDSLPMDADALFIAKRALAQPPAACPKCGGTGEADSGGIMPWGAPAMILCECQQPAAVDGAKPSDGAKRNEP